MPYTLGQAAKASGRSKATIHRAVTAGRLSASRTDSGGWLIEVAELHRVYPPVVSRDGAGNGPRDTTQPLANGGEPGEVASLRERIAEQAETIRDLRARLDAESEERRQTQARLVGLLTHRQPGSVPATGSGVPGPWWRRWRRSGVL
jgi:hypothetical protein